MAVTPAGAEVAQAAATSWKKIWKKELKPLADKRYYQKSQSDTKYASKAEAAAAAAAAQSAATSAANSATDSKLGGYYKKTETDAKYAAAPKVVRGQFVARGIAPGVSTDGADISFGLILPTAPVTHYIATGAPAPAGCSGTVLAPGAAPGHLCVFEGAAQNTAHDGIYNAQGLNGASRFGAYLYVDVLAAGAYRVTGSWAVGVSEYSVAGGGPAVTQPGPADDLD